MKAITLMALMLATAFQVAAEPPKTWQEFGKGPGPIASLQFPVSYYAEEAINITKNYRYISNPNAAVKSLEQFFMDGGGDCDDFVFVWHSFLTSTGVQKKMMEIRTLSNRNGTSHQILILNNEVILSAGPELIGAFEMSQLELWK